MGDSRWVVWEPCVLLKDLPTVLGHTHSSSTARQTGPHGTCKGLAGTQASQLSAANPSYNQHPPEPEMMARVTGSSRWSALRLRCCCRAASGCAAGPPEGLSRNALMPL